MHLSQTALALVLATALPAQTTWHPVPFPGQTGPTLVEVFALVQDGDTIDLGGARHWLNTSPGGGSPFANYRLDKAVTIEGRGGTIETLGDFGARRLDWQVTSGSTRPIVIRDVNFSVAGNSSYYDWGNVNLDHRAGDVVLENVTVRIGPTYRPSVGTPRYAVVSIRTSKNAYCRDVDVLQLRGNDRSPDLSGVFGAWPGTSVSARAFYAHRCRFEGGNGPHATSNGSGGSPNDGEPGLTVTASHAIYSDCVIEDGDGGGWLMSAPNAPVLALGRSRPSRLGTNVEFWNSRKDQWDSNISVGLVVATPQVWPVRTVSTYCTGDDLGWTLDVTGGDVGQSVTVTAQRVNGSVTTLGYLLGIDALTDPVVMPVDTPFGVISISPIAGRPLGPISSLIETYPIPNSPAFVDTLFSVQLVFAGPVLGQTAFTIFR